MKKLKRQLIFLHFIAFLSVGKAQNIGLTIEKNVKTPPQYSHLFVPKNTGNYVNSPAIVSPTFQQPKPIPQAFSVESLPFFCKIEYKMGLNQKFPLKFRLGDVQYVDEMEGK